LEPPAIPGRFINEVPGHAALLSELGEGELSYMSGSKTEKFTISGGYVDVRDNHVRVLADKVE